MGRLDFRELEISHRRFYSVLLSLGVVLLGVAYAFSRIESQGHFITGMNNRVVWGLPHVVAMWLIIAAAGVVHIASLGAVFNKPDDKPYGRVSLVLGISLLLGGLSLIVADLGRADRLIIALTHFNFDSIFAWNILRYSVFFMIMGLYLWSMMDRSAVAKRCFKTLSYLAFIWPLILMAGAGSIFGVLEAREYYDTVTMVPLFIALSYLVGTAVFALVLIIISKLESDQLGDTIQQRLVGRLCLLILVAALIELVRHLFNYFVIGNTEIEVFILLNAGVITWIFWIGQLLIGCFMPFAFLRWFDVKQYRLAIVSVLVLCGALCQLYVIIIGGQSQPLSLFPNSVMDAAQAIEYSPSVIEWALSLGGLAVALFVFTVSVAVLRIIPENTQ